MNKAAKTALRVVVCVLTALFLAAAFVLSGSAVINYGPSKTARDLFVVSMLETSAMKFLATWYFSPEEIDSICSENAVEAESGFSDPSLVTFDTNAPPVETETDVYFPGDTGVYSHVTETDVITGEVTETTAAETKYEPPEYKNASLYLSEGGIDIYDVTGGTFKGKMMVVHDPSRVTIGTRGDNLSDGKPGKTLKKMAREANATGAVNGGGFYDPNGSGNGGEPTGIVIKDGRIVYGSASKEYEVIGFTKNNVFVVGKMTGQKALDIGIRDAITFGPVLVMNGKPSKVSGSGSGINPRTAIGQRADGSVLLLAVDGRMATSIGATYADLIDVMTNFGAINAANLDGGTSTHMYYKGELITNGMFERELPDCVIVK